ncbi:hypothetical protein [Parapedobacter koreensis]|nr:hypothetical protein [Parapedobacter koreensis]
MKALEKLTDMDKAKLLHDLFPNEIKPLLDYISRYCEDLKFNPDKHSKGWSNRAIMTFEYWQGLGEQVEETITLHYMGLLKFSGTFSAELFYGIKGAFVIQCLLRWARTECKNKKFKLAIALLYLEN